MLPAAETERGAHTHTGIRMIDGAIDGLGCPHTLISPDLSTVRQSSTPRRHLSRRRRRRLGCTGRSGAGAVAPVGPAHLCAGGGAEARHHHPTHLGADQDRPLVPLQAGAHHPHGAGAPLHVHRQGGRAPRERASNNGLSTSDAQNLSLTSLPRTAVLQCKRSGSPPPRPAGN